MPKRGLSLAVVQAEPDHVLLLRIANEHDRAAFEELYDRHKASWFNLSLHLTGRQDLAEETVQDASLRIWRYAKTYRQEFEAGPWMNRILVRSCFAQINAKKKHEGEQEWPSMNEMEICQENLAISGEGAELLGALRNAIYSLAPKERQLVALYFGAGFTQEECGKELQLPTRTVSDRLKRVLDGLRKRLEIAGFGAVIPALGQKAIRDAILTGFEPPSEMLTNILNSLNGAANRSIRSSLVLGNKIKIAIALVLLALVGMVGWAVVSQSESSDKLGVSTGRHPDVPDGGNFDESDRNPTESSEQPFERLRQTWEFDNPDGTKGLEILKGKWHWEAHAGLNGSGCMKTDTTDFLLRIDIPIHRLPVRITYAYGLINIPDKEYVYYNYLCWERFQYGAYFHDAGISRRYLNTTDWYLAETFVSDQMFDKWEGGKRAHLCYFHPQQGCNSIVLRCGGLQRLDRITLEEVLPSEVPSVTPFIAALSDFEPNERAGIHSRPDLPSGGPGKTVAISFITGTPWIRSPVPEHDKSNANAEGR